MKIRASVILLSFNAWHLVHARMAELYKYLPSDCELVWVDNGTTEEAAMGGMVWWQDIYNKPLQFYRFPVNQGFSIGNNKGAELAVGEYLIFLSTDVVIHRPFVDDIISTLTEHPKWVLGGRVIDWPGGWNQISIGGREWVIPYCEGYALALRRDAWEDAGGYDPRYSPADCEDIDLSIALASKGYELHAVPPGYFTHLGGGTFQANGVSPDTRMQTTIRNKQRLVEKWADRLPEVYP